MNEVDGYSRQTVMLGHKLCKEYLFICDDGGRLRFLNEERCHWYIRVSFRHDFICNVVARCIFISKAPDLATYASRAHTVERAYLLPVFGCSGHSFQLANPLLLKLVVHFHLHVLFLCQLKQTLIIVHDHSVQISK